MRLVTTEEMRRLEQAAVDDGSTWASLMEQAGWGVAQEALHLLGDVRGRCVLVLVGPGNNGGDGLVTARHLHDAGAQVWLYIWQRFPNSQDMNWQRCRDRRMKEIVAADDSNLSRLRKLLGRADLVVDALLGMGISRPVTGALAAIVQTLNDERQTARVLSIDMPTGVHSDNGAVMGVAIHADLTVATGLAKRGLLLYPGKRYAGTVIVADIGLPSGDLEMVMSETIGREHARGLLPARPEDSHKGTFGKVLVVAGSLYYPGAAVLATAGAGRAGAGLVTLATARSILLGGGRYPEVTLLPLPEASLGTLGREAAEELLKSVEEYQSLLIGCGLGHEEPTSLFLQHVLKVEQPRTRTRVGFRASSLVTEPETATGRTKANLPPTVLDADGLNLLAEIENWHELLPRERFILTPHPGEMRRLLKVDTLDEDYVQATIDAATRWEQVVVLKGATTVIAAPDGRSFVHAGGNAALATAGTGDVLAGVIAGLLAQGVGLVDAAVLGVYLHGAAGALVRDEVGDMGALASDLLPRLPRVIKELRAKS